MTERFITKGIYIAMFRLHKKHFTAFSPVCIINALCQQLLLILMSSATQGVCARANESFVDVI